MPDEEGRYYPRTMKQWRHGLELPSKTNETTPNDVAVIPLTMGGGIVSGKWDVTEETTLHFRPS